MQATASTASAVVEAAALPLREGEISDYDPLLDLIGDARYVLLGEAGEVPETFPSGM